MIPALTCPPLPRAQPESPTDSPLPSAGRLLQPHLRAMRAVALRLCGDPADADDAVQDACVLALTRLHQVRDRGMLRAWLCAVVANAARMQRRRGQTARRHSTGRGEAGMLEVRDLTPLPDERCHQHHRLQALRRAWQAMAADQRQALELREIDGLSFAEAALRLHTTAQAVKTRVCRTRAQLRAALA